MADSTDYIKDFIKNLKVEQKNDIAQCERYDLLKTQIDVRINKRSLVIDKLKELLSD